MSKNITYFYCESTLIMSYKGKCDSDFEISGKGKWALNLRPMEYSFPSTPFPKLNKLTYLKCWSDGLERKKLPRIGFLFCRTINNPTLKCYYHSQYICIYICDICYILDCYNFYSKLGL